MIEPRAQDPLNHGHGLDLNKLRGQRKALIWIPLSYSLSLLCAVENVCKFPHIPQGREKSAGKRRGHLTRQAEGCCLLRSWKEDKVVLRALLQ